MIYSGIWIFWLLMMGCGFIFWGFGSRRYSWRRHGFCGCSDDSYQLARERYARGEISVQEYEELIKTLRTK